jgi:hypothetical protein
MVKRFGLALALAGAIGALAACTNPTAPTASPRANTIHATQRSAGTLIGSDT